VFLKEVSFVAATFVQGADFSDGKFYGGAWFAEGKFLNKSTSFSGASFQKLSETTEDLISDFSPRVATRMEYSSDSADFNSATFDEECFFIGTEFTKANFGESVFRKEANFNLSKFIKAEFGGTRFEGGANFTEAVFAEVASFRASVFLGKTIFSPGELLFQANKLIFSEAYVFFNEVTIDPLDTVTFRSADLTKCKLQDTDVREIEFTAIRWPRIGSRLVVYDEIEPLPGFEILNISGVSDADFRDQLLLRTERIYRQLKQN
jgi:uncharacterized protein YjbI with pentapeptide repeats